MDKFNGVGVAIVTPFKQDTSIDYKGFEKLIEHLITGGVDYLVVQGTTGEAATLNREQKNNSLDFVIETVNNRVPVVYGHGGNNTAAVIEQLEDIDSLAKVDALLSASPAYVKPNQEGIYRHFEAVAKATDKPIILYNVPGRTGSNMAASTTLSLAREFSNIVGIKEASGDLAQMTQLIKNRPENFKVISGDDDLVLPQMAIGADGVISVIANAFPKRFKSLIEAGKSGDLETARKYHYQLCDIIPLLFKEGSPSGIKAVLEMLGICESTVRLPVAPISKELRDELYRTIGNAGISLD
ncbi:MAG: 4-hydroxy-tetrahydrodipicolinate synthase [Salibacter sp.]|uniref:4-hydroxy-tetrahydrodipicolinate synthase n=1 Tax=Salibacter sp. TaxID=2010995 RepID=UPI00286FC5AB|nr:4-hydroxy-tetrahydrodipicolinate synthase [Salibacter sp.]MDR9398088.1 4-hydroxy-tetrahydrodipicolinate synthase [Salibacter sp.]